MKTNTTYTKQPVTQKGQYPMRTIGLCGNVT